MLEGVLRQLPNLLNNEFIKTILMHEYFRNDQVIDVTLAIASVIRFGENYHIG